MGLTLRAMKEDKDVTISKQTDSFEGHKTKETEREKGQLACREKMHRQTWRYLHQLINNDARGGDMELPTSDQHKDTRRDS